MKEKLEKIAGQESICDSCGMQYSLYCDFCLNFVYEKDTESVKDYKVNDKEVRKD